MEYLFPNLKCLLIYNKNNYFINNYYLFIYLFLQKIKSIENISNSNCESESLRLMENKQEMSDTFDNYLQNAHSSVKLPPVSPVSVFIEYQHIYCYKN